MFYSVTVAKREIGENPMRSRRCKCEKAFYQIYRRNGFDEFKITYIEIQKPG